MLTAALNTVAAKLLKAACDEGLVVEQICDQ